MGFRFLKTKKGFTLVEILIVVVIIAILVAIAVPKFISIATEAEHSVLKYNSTYLVKILAMNIYSYEGEARYSDNELDNSLNNFLENEVVGTQVDGNENNIKNPKSRSLKIVQGSGVADEDENPAVFITGNDEYKFTESETENLKGTIVVYFNQDTLYNVQVYYIDSNGEKADVKTADFK